MRNRRTKTAIRSSGLARLLQTCRRAPPIRKSNRRGPHSPATRSTGIEEDSRRRENEERVAQYNYFTARASNRSAWARAGMG